MYYIIDTFELRNGSIELSGKEESAYTGELLEVSAI